MTTIDPLAYPQRRCAAESSYPGSGRQCRRSAAEIRDGRPLCWQHAAAPSVTYPEAPAPRILPDPIIPEPTAREVDEADLIASVRAGMDKLEDAVNGVGGTMRLLARIAASDESQVQRLARLFALLPPEVRRSLAVQYDLPGGFVQ